VLCPVGKKAAVVRAEPMSTCTAAKDTSPRLRTPVSRTQRNIWRKVDAVLNGFQWQDISSIALVSHSRQNKHKRMCLSDLLLTQFKP